MNTLFEWLRAARLLNASESRLIHWHALALAVALALLTAIPARAQSGITDLIVARKVNLQGNATPAALTVDVNDYAPAGMQNATFLRLSSTVPVNISGIAGGTHGRMLWLINVGAFNLTLLDQSALSLAGNRFAIGGPTVIPPGAAVSFWYDGTTALRWLGLVQGKSTTSWGGITGNITNQTDLNDAMARLAQASLTTGVADENDTVLLSAPNATTLRIAALQAGVFAALLGPGLPVTTAVKTFPQTDYPLASLGLVADGTFARWIGYNQAGTVVASTTSFVNDETVISLGAIVVKRVGGVTSFIDDGGPRSFATLPQMSGFSELERTYLGYESTVTITPASTNMTLARSAGIIRGISINWTGIGNKNSLDQTAVSGASFIQVNPALASGTVLPGAVTVMTATNFWNGAASVPLANNNNASVKRFLLGIKGGLFVQEGELQYTNLDAAVAAYATAPFTTLLAQDLFIEIGRVAVVKNASDLSNPTQARFFVIGSGSGGSSGGSPSAVTSINGTAGEVAVNSPVGAVTISLPAALVFTGKTIAGGTYNAPVLTNAALGTPASGVLTNATGTALGLTAGTVVTNANLTGDVTSTGNATTLATVTGTVGSFGSASLIPIVTVNAKGLVTNVTTVSIGGPYQPTGNYMTALTGDVAASGPGSAAATLATVNANVGSFGSVSAVPVITVDGKGRITAVSTAAISTGAAAAGTLTGTTLAANVVNASLNNITPTGGTLTVTSSNSNTLILNRSGGVGGPAIVFQRSGSATGFIGDNSNGIDLFDASAALRASVSSSGLAVTGSVTASAGVRLATNNTYFIGTTTGAVNQNLLGVGGDDNTYLFFGTGKNLTVYGSASVATFSTTGLAVTGSITASVAGPDALVINGGSSTTQTYQRMANGGGNYYIGISSSTGGGLLGGLGNYGFAILSESNRNVGIGVNNTLVGLFSSTGLAVTGNLSVSGSITKGSGTFSIPHPLASLTKTTNLVHSFIEGPKADLIYRGRVTLANGKATVDIDKSAGMTSGTFVALAENPQVWLQNESNGYSVRGKVVGATLTVEGTAGDSISWLVIAERHDAVIKAASFTDANGKVILEPRKDAPAKKVEAASPKI